MDTGTITEKEKLDSEKIRISKTPKKCNECPLVPAIYQANLRNSS